MCTQMTSKSMFHESEPDLLDQSEISELFTAAKLKIHPGLVMAALGCRCVLKVKQMLSCFYCTRSKAKMRSDHMWNFRDIYQCHIKGNGS